MNLIEKTINEYGESEAFDENTSVDFHDSELDTDSDDEKESDEK